MGHRAEGARSPPPAGGKANTKARRHEGGHEEGGGRESQRHGGTEVRLNCGTASPIQTKQLKMASMASAAWQFGRTSVPPCLCGSLCLRLRVPFVSSCLRVRLPSAEAEAAAGPRNDACWRHATASENCGQLGGRSVTGTTVQVFKSFEILEPAIRMTHPNLPADRVFSGASGVATSDNHGVGQIAGKIARSSKVAPMKAASGRQTGRGRIPRTGRRPPAT